MRLTARNGSRLIFELACWVSLASLSACASAPALSQDGSSVRQITVQKARTCDFLANVKFAKAIDGLGKTPSLVQEIGLNGLKNDVAAAGGNAYLLTDQSSDWFIGYVDLAARAYQCKFP